MLTVFSKAKCTIVMVFGMSMLSIGILLLVPRLPIIALELTILAVESVCARHQLAREHETTAKKARNGVIVD